MSHAATNRAIQQRGLKPATKIVLWFLCDRHNPDFGCFPTQARLAEDAAMSISARNEHLATLEDLGLIHRIRAHDPRSHRRQPTRYILGLEAEFPQEPPPESGDNFVKIMEENDDPSPESPDGAISRFPGVPSPDFSQSHLRNPEYNLVREPLTKPVKEEEEDAAAREIDCPPTPSATQSATPCCHAALSRRSDCGRGVCIERGADARKSALTDEIKDRGTQTGILPDRLAPDPGRWPGTVKGCGRGPSVGLPRRL